MNRPRIYNGSFLGFSLVAYLSREQAEEQTGYTLHRMRRGKGGGVESTISSTGGVVATVI